MKEEKKMKTSLQKRKTSASGKKLIVTLEVDKDVLLYYGSADMGILYSNIRFWCLHNEDQQEETHFHKGIWWTYNTGEGFAKSFPFWKIRKIYRMLDILEKDGFIRKDCFNKIKLDRTSWYSIIEKDEEAIVKNDNCQLSNMTIATTHNDNTIPDSKLQIDKQQIDTIVSRNAVPNINDDLILEDSLVKEDKHDYSSLSEGDKKDNLVLEVQNGISTSVSTPSPLQPSVPETPIVVFDWNVYLDKMLINPKKHIVFIAKYFKIKHIKFTSKEAASAAIVRNVKIATKLINSFSSEELNWSVKYCKNCYDRKGLTWNLDTLLKVISTVPMTDDGTDKNKSYNKLIAPEGKYDNIKTLVVKVDPREWKK